MREADPETGERVLTFLESMAPEQTAFLNRIENEALDAEVPIIRTQTRSLIQFLMLAGKPHRILEIGTGTGFSACVMLTYAPEGAELVTMERDPQRAAEARKTFEAFRKESPSGIGRVALLEGDAAELLPSMDGTFDFIFMDAAKGQYIHFLPEVLRLLSPDGMLLSDNIFMDGMILESRYAVPRRERTIHRRMREYLLALTRDPALQTLLLQEGDGAALTMKKPLKTQGT